MAAHSTNVSVTDDTCLAVGDDSADGLNLVASLLKVNEDALSKALLTRQLYVRGKVIVQQQHSDQVRGSVMRWQRLSTRRFSCGSSPS